MELRDFLESCLLKKIRHKFMQDEIKVTDLIKEYQAAQDQLNDMVMEVEANRVNNQLDEGCLP
jgi:cell fate (sporulation/competence/biofilm development) regulator YmcA (YheA/YmcA/DUF963 family)